MKRGDIRSTQSVPAMRLESIEQHKLPKWLFIDKTPSFRKKKKLPLPDVAILPKRHRLAIEYNSLFGHTTVSLTDDEVSLCSFVADQNNFQRLSLNLGGNSRVDLAKKKYVKSMHQLSEFYSQNDLLEAQQEVPDFGQEEDDLISGRDIEIFADGFDTPREEKFENRNETIDEIPDLTDEQIHELISEQIKPLSSKINSHVVAVSSQSDLARANQQWLDAQHKTTLNGTIRHYAPKVDRAFKPENFREKIDGIDQTLTKRRLATFISKRSQSNLD